MHRTFLLGVGAQKAGTTWLHESLSALKEANFGTIKEYHVWDVLHSDAFNRFRVRREDLVPGRAGLAVRYRMQNEPGYYSSYFKQILDLGYSLTGDVTPSYAALATGDLMQIRAQVEAMNARLRVVFLMRDPFERCWSAIRMFKNKKNLTESDDALLLRLYAQEDAVLRTRYDRTVQTLRSAFPAEELYFGLYETMHEDRELQRLSHFLGVEIDRTSTRHIHNASPKSEPISPETRKLVQAFYRDVYEYCGQEFPESRRHWII